MSRFRMSKKANIAVVSVIALAFLLVIVLHENQFANPQDELIKKCIAGTIIVVSILLYIVLYDKITVLPAELYQNRKLIWKLAKNDFKTRYAGSYLGMVWAFVQPIVTILVYWFVFEKGFNAKAEMLANGLTAPYVLWLTAGIVPWFYFSEALSNGTTALLEYNYLVKKVVFKISILPIIKIIAIFLQVGMWATPILWELNKIPPKYQILFKLNPVFYIVNGYRSALLEKSWFYNRTSFFVYSWTNGVPVL